MLYWFSVVTVVTMKWSMAMQRAPVEASWQIQTQITISVWYEKACLKKKLHCKKISLNSYISWGKLVFDNKGRKLLNISFNFQLFSLMIKDVSQMNAQFRKASKTQSFECPLFSCGKSKILKEKTTLSISFPLAANVVLCRFALKLKLIRWWTRFRNIWYVWSRVELYSIRDEISCLVSKSINQQSLMRILWWYF